MIEALRGAGMGCSSEAAHSTLSYPALFSSKSVPALLSI